MRARFRDEHGFTLIELLVVILIIGILAGIALPMFLGQQQKAGDVDAKSLARNLAIQVESCYTPSEDFRDCDTAAKLGEFLAGIDYGTGPGQAYVQSAQKDSYVVVAVSKTDTNGTNHTFTLSHSTQGQNDRSCTAGPSNDQGGCDHGTW